MAEMNNKELAEQLERMAKMTPQAAESKTTEFTEATKKETKEVDYTNKYKWIPDASAPNGYREASDQEKAELKRKYKHKPGTTEYVERTEEELAKYDKNLDTKNRKTGVVKKFKSMSEAVVSKTARQVRQAFQDSARIIGYVVAKGDKIDFAAKSKTTNTASGSDPMAKTNAVTEYTIGLKNSAPTTIKFAVVKYSVGLKNLLESIGQKDDSDIAQTLAVYKNAGQNDMAIELIPWNEVSLYINNYTMGQLFEDDKLFAPVTVGKNENAKTYNTVADIPAKTNLPAGSYLYNSIKLSKPTTLKEDKKDTGKIDLSKIFVLKHSVRAKILTPENVIPLSRFKTIKPLTSYGDDEATKMTKLYLDRFNSGSGKNGPVAQNLGDTTGLIIDGGSKTIVGSDFFATSGHKSWFTGNNGVAHWSKKGSDGNPEMIPASQVAIVRKCFASDNNPQAKNPDKVVTLQESLAAAGTGADYEFSAANFSKIFEASNGMLTAKEILDAAAKSRHRNTNKAPKETSVLSPSDFIGLKESDIAAQLSEAFAG